MVSPVTGLDPLILSWIEEKSGGVVVRADRIPGGAIRQGWFVDIDRGPDRVDEVFLRTSPVPASASSGFHRLSVEAEVVSALRETEVPVARILAVHPDLEAVLMERIPGDTWFYRIQDPEEQVRVAQDFIRSLSAQHRLDPQALAIRSLGPVRTPAEHAAERIEAIRRRGTAADGSIDPLLRITLDWLAGHIPDYDGPVVLVQGDTGPGNFLYQQGRVTAVVDWELCHFGDPMDDIAWLSLRAVQDTFTHLPDRLREYETLSGHGVDQNRVDYYRLFAEATMTTLEPPGRPEPIDGAPIREATDDLGNVLIYHQLHRRLWIEILIRAMGLNLARPAEPDPEPLSDWYRSYDDALATLRTVAPRISDPLAAQWTRGTARLIKYLQSADRRGRAFNQLELDDLTGLLGTHPTSLSAGRTALAEANRAGLVADDDYISYAWNKILRDDLLLASASGALSRRTWPDLG